MATEATLAQLVTKAKADEFSWSGAFLQSHAAIDTRHLLPEKNQVASRKQHAVHTRMRQLAEFRLKGHETAKTLNSSGSPDGNIDLIFTTCDKMEDLWKRAADDEGGAWPSLPYYMCETECDEITRGMKECVSQLKILSESLKPTVVMP